MVLLSMVPSADSDGIMPNSALGKNKFGPFFMPHRGFHLVTHQERSSIDMVYRYNLIEAPALHYRFLNLCWKSAQASLSCSIASHNRANRGHGRPMIANVRQAQALFPRGAPGEWLRFERVARRCFSPKIGVGRCFLRDNKRGLCSRLT